jgi:[ribosomal protein S5]-alanine N-acetyltransferase
MAPGPASPRLEFRPFAAADVAELHRHWNDLDVRRHLWDDQPVALEAVRAVLAASAATFRAGAYGIWVLRDHAGATIGSCGLRPVDDGGEIEILYSVAPARWGEGIATEAAHAVLRFAFTELGLARVVGGVDDANHASRRVLVKLGMRAVDAPPEAPPGVHYLGVARAEFAASVA